MSSDLRGQEVRPRRRTTRAGGVSRVPPHWGHTGRAVAGSVWPQPEGPDHDGGRAPRREIGFTSLHEALDTTTPGRRLVFHVFAALAGFIRELIVQGAREGLEAACARGKVGGRQTVVTRDPQCRPRLAAGPAPLHHSIAKLHGVSAGTLYHHVPDLRELRAAPQIVTDPKD